MAIFDEWGQPNEWRTLNWKERIGLSVFWVVGFGVVVPVGLIAILMIFGMMIEGIGQHNVQHDRCLKHATNGYEIKQCR